MEQYPVFAQTIDIAACVAEKLHSCVETNDVQSIDERDSFASLLERGTRYQARDWDPEAYRFAQWLHAASATRFIEGKEGQSSIASARICYRRYATMQAHARVSRALQEPFLARHIVRQDFLSVRLLFDKGMTCGGTTYHLTSALAERILSYLGYRAAVVLQVKTPKEECMDDSRMCPLFLHRLSRMSSRRHEARLQNLTSSRSTLTASLCYDEIEVSDDEYMACGLQSSTSSQSSSIAFSDVELEMSSDMEHEISDDASIFSSGSVSAAHDCLRCYLLSQERPVTTDDEH
eukprot:TRINITY_DN8267_c0_g1_i2.p1 TRINITY_DN8267_c0_g1~~TRINITY_DN8267_c0_g1_i2.p1  ORF type:complete len:291 (-),score=35.39 TRINITY_DN8267_c0_g1_i2:234-1106(-)